MTKEHKNKIIAIETVFFTLVPFMAKAALVNCGNEGQNPCTYDDFITLINAIIQFALFNIAIPLTVVMVVWGGILIASSGGNESKVKKGKDIITGTFVGLAIAFGAWLIVNTVVNILF